MRATNLPMAKLVVLSEGFTGLSYELKAEKTTVGRLDDNSFAISEPSISSHHCEIIQTGAEVVVRDLNSTNGTFINGDQLTGEAPLKSGQILRLGQVEIRLESGVPATAPAKKPLDKTMVISPGVKMQELDPAARHGGFESNSAFTRKSNKANKVFIAVGAILGALVVGLIIFALSKLRE